MEYNSEEISIKLTLCFVLSTFIVIIIRDVNVLLPLESVVN